MRINHQFAQVLRWAARILGTPLAILIFLDFLSDASGTHGPGPWNIFKLSWTEQILLDVVLLASFGLLVAWRRETVGGWIATTCGVVFLTACLLVPGMRTVWGLGIALAIPGFLYLLAAHESHRLPGRPLAH